MNAAERQLLDESVARVIQKGTQTAGQLLDEVQNWVSRHHGSPETNSETEQSSSDDEK